MPTYRVRWRDGADWQHIRANSESEARSKAIEERFRVLQRFPNRDVLRAAKEARQIKSVEEQ